ncbi:LysE family translocator [Cohnella pontilimi]|uniref:LysE family translocator n=1 Tax=Cohnella pontilimi TaxID=2564100 RepID=A0A4U0FDE5_9BACL|nr:LysE family translocator [Cohnella pontilimi]TJY42800.1 LysE family translocator [Cohnella pontilimi]
MDMGVWMAFLGASVILTLMPGPDILFVIAQSAAGGPKQGSAIALGLCTGLLAHISAAALGVSAVVYGLPYAMPAVKTAGSLYLLYLAWMCLKPAKPAAAPVSASEVAAGQERPVAMSYGRLYRRGILMNVLNPKVSLFFIAFLPSFVRQGAGPVPVQMFVLGFTFLLQSLVIFHLVAMFAGRLGRRYLQRGEAARRRTSIAEGLLYATLALFLLFG